jgi:hypothetical protein
MQLVLVEELQVRQQLVLVFQPLAQRVQQLVLQALVLMQQLRQR